MVLLILATSGNEGGDNSVEDVAAASDKKIGGLLRVLEYVSWLIEWITRWACVATLSAMTAIVFAQVILRFVFNNALPWPEEISRYLMIWSCFLGSSLAVKYGEHIGVLFIVEKIPDGIRKYISFVIRLAIMVFLAFAAYHGFRMLEMTRRQVAPASGLNMAIAYAAIPVGSLFGLVHAIVNIFEKPQESDVVLSI